MCEGGQKFSFFLSCLMVFEDFLGEFEVNLSLWASH